MTRMFNALNRLRNDESGFTVVEIVISALVLFFVLTATVGLLGRSTSMTAEAKSKSVLNDAITGRMDAIRVLPFSAIAYRTSGGQIDQVSQPQAVNGFTIVYTTTIVDRSGSTGTKEITIVGVATREGFPTTTSRAFAAVRNRVGGTTNTSGSIPTIQFMSVTPRADSIVVANKTAANDPLTIAVRAAATGERTISRIEIAAGSNAGNVLLRDGTTIYANDAEREFPSAPNSVETFSFTWHTGQVNQDGVKSIQDGRRVIRAIAYDDQGRPSAPRERTFIVDNLPPSPPTNVSLVGTARANLSQDLTPSWTTPMDGTDPAPYIESQIREDLSGASDLADWSSVSQQQTPSVVQAEPFGRYVLRSRALSPLRDPSDWVVSGRVFTRPVIGNVAASDTSDVIRSKRTNSQDRWTYVTRFRIPRPRFPYVGADWSTGHPVIEVLENGVAIGTLDGSAVNTAWQAGQSYSFTRTLVMDMGKNVTPTAPSYQLRVTLTPLGYGGGSPVTITSNYVRPWSPSDEASFKYTTPPNTISQTALPLSVSW